MADPHSSEPFQLIARNQEKLEMKRIQSILCASLLTLAMSSATFAGNIYGRNGNIYGVANPTTTAPGTIYGLTYGDLLGLLTVVIP